MNAQETSLPPMTRPTPPSVVIEKLQRILEELSNESLKDRPTRDAVEYIQLIRDAKKRRDAAAQGLSYGLSYGCLRSSIINNAHIALGHKCLWRIRHKVYDAQISKEVAERTIRITLSMMHRILRAQNLLLEDMFNVISFGTSIIRLMLPCVTYDPSEIVKTCTNALADMIRLGETKARTQPRIMPRIHEHMTHCYYEAAKCFEIIKDERSVAESVEKFSQSAEAHRIMLLRQGKVLPAKAWMSKIEQIFQDFGFEI
jgi:hypothetical protein